MIPVRFVALLIGVCVDVLAMAQYPALTRVITFNKLKASATYHELEWTNPGGNIETMRLTVMAIPVDQKMKKLTREFEKANYGIDSLYVDPHAIVFHAMGDGDLRRTLEISSFLNDKISASWGNLSKAGWMPNGAHFIVDRSGEVICLTPPVGNDGTISFARSDHKWIIKRHQDANPVAIGIENVTEKDDYTGLTPEQLEANAKLARWLMWMDEGIVFLTSHHQFNDDAFNDAFLANFDRKHLQKKFRTRGRQDVGDDNLKTIIQMVNAAGYHAREFRK